MAYARVVSDVPDRLSGPEVTTERYGELLDAVAERIQSAQGRAVRVLSAELTLAYWHIGREITVRVRDQGWGAGVIERLSTDLRTRFAGVRGFSVSNLRYMRAFAAAWSQEEVEAGPAGMLPWSHNITLLSVADHQRRSWYAHQATAGSWTRVVLEHNVATDLFARSGRAVSNFADVLPAPTAMEAQLVTKDPYSLEFLGLGVEAKERDLEDALLVDLQRFMLELGVGFAFYGRQHALVVDDQEFFLDLLFYHHRLRRFVIIDLKIGRFEPEFAGKMNFYLNAVDDQMRVGDDGQSIGLILCTSRSETVAKLALRGIETPIAVSGFNAGPPLIDEAPTDLADDLPIGRIRDEVALLAKRNDTEVDPGAAP